MGVPEDKKSLDCLLISPYFHQDSESIMKGIASNFTPLGLAFLAAYVRQKGYSVRILDCNIHCPSLKEVRIFFEKTFVPEFKNIRIIGLTVITPTVKKAYKIAEICKEFYPDSIIVFGGTHATFLADEVIDNKVVDIVVAGEGEITLEEILAGKDLEKIKGIVFRKRINNRDEIIRTPPRERIVDLDSLPMPAYDLLPVLKYKPAKGSYKRLPAVEIITSRGCPGRCTFCNRTLGNGLTFHSIERIFEEIQWLIKNYKTQQLFICDDTFTVNRDNVVKFCDMLIKNKIDISWVCSARVDLVDFEMLKKMQKAGCNQIVYGVESSEETVLKNINKKISPGEVINAVKLTKKAGLECRLSFMLGSPGDSAEIIRENIKFLNKVNPDILLVNITTPFPGTDMFNWAKEKDLILTYDWDEYTQSKPIMRIKGLTSKQIIGFYKLMYRSFYLRPAYILKRVFNIRSFNDFKRNLEGLNALFSFFYENRLLALRQGTK